MRAGAQAATLARMSFEQGIALAGVIFTYVAGLLGLLGYMMWRQSKLAKDVYEKIERVRDGYVRRDDLDKHFSMIERVNAEIKESVRRLNERLDQVIVMLKNGNGKHAAAALLMLVPLIFGAPAKAEQRPRCYAYPEMLTFLDEHWNEAVRGEGFEENDLVVVTLTVSPRGTWTLVFTNLAGVSCIAFYGTDFVLFPAPPPQAGFVE